MKEKISLDVLTNLLNYDYRTGVFTWVTKPYRSSVLIGSKTGTVNGSGYVCITLKGVIYRAHRLAWFYVYGEWPLGQIDHINRVRHDNRIANLRIVDSSQNQQNTVAPITNKSGFKGVCFSESKGYGYWRASIMFQGKRISLGNFPNKEEAAYAYANAASKIHQYNPSARMVAL